MPDNKQQLEEKIEKKDRQIDYLRQVIRDKKYPQEAKRGAETSLARLLKERDTLLDSLSGR